MCVSSVSKFFPIEQGHSIISQSRGENQKVLEEWGRGTEGQVDQTKNKVKKKVGKFFFHTHTF